MKLCLFDLDHTLLPIDSDHAFGEFLVRIGWADAHIFRARNDEFYRQYQSGRLDIDAYVDFATAAWRTRSLDERRWVQARFMDEVVHPAIAPQARELVRRHQASDDLVAIVTATNEFVTRPIAQAFDVDHLMAIELETDEGGNINGRIRGIPSFQHGKIARVEQWLSGLGHRLEDFDTVTFYSDSPNDLPLLELATDPVATNPSPALEAIARERGWRIVNLFQ